MLDKILLVLRLIGTVSEKWEPEDRKSPNCTNPTLSFNALGVTPFEFCDEPDYTKKTILGAIHR